MDRGFVPARTSSLNSGTPASHGVYHFHDFDADRHFPLCGRTISSDETWMNFLRSDGSDVMTRAMIDRLGDLDEASEAGMEEHEQRSASSAAARYHTDRKRRLTSPDDRGRRRSGQARADVNAAGSSREQESQPATIRSPTHATLRNFIDLTGDTPRRPCTSRAAESASEEIVLPRWQADAEASKCPVCGVQFSFWYRKHHCRKCGRVVCANCSPHRITIPRQFIVHPPGLDNMPSAKRPLVVDLTGSDGDQRAASRVRTAAPLSNQSSVNPALGGGEEVRVCNPCVPDPNYNPPPQQPASSASLTRQSIHPNLSGFEQTTTSSQPPLFRPRQTSAVLRHPSADQILGIAEPTAHSRMPIHRSFHSDGAHITTPMRSPFQNQNLLLRSQGGQLPQSDVVRPRRVTVQYPASPSDIFAPPRNHSFAAPTSFGSQFAPQGLRRPMPGRGLNVPSLAPGHTWNRVQEFQGPPVAPSIPHRRQVSTPSPSVSAPTPVHQRERRRQINEEDECPVCGNELPPKGADGSETAREQHVEECLRTHLLQPPITLPAATTTPGSVSSSSAPAAASAFPPAAASPHTVSARHLVPGQEQTQQQREQQQAAPRRAMGNRMLIYRATEKDCTGDDGNPQECIICFEEFEVGDEMGRLECLCKFHRACIRQWWATKGVGTCPTHQLHD